MMRDYFGLQIPETFQELLGAISQNTKVPTKKQMKNRRNFLEPIKKFHKGAGTLTDSVRRTLRILEKEKDYILITCAHQPNFLPYAGVVRKIALMEAIKQKLEELKPVVCYYQFSDQTLPDRWVKTAQIPDVTSKMGHLNISNPEIRAKPHYSFTGYGKYSKRINSIPKPSSETLLMWKNKIRSWTRNSLKSGKRLAKELGYNDIREALFKNEKSLIRNVREFIKIFDESYEQVKNFADLNAFMLSKIVNNIWGYGTLFARDSETSRFLKEETLYLLQNYPEYFDALREAKLEIKNTGITTKLMPFWYHCECGGKVNLFTDDKITGNGQTLKQFQGNCLNCKKLHKFDASEIRLENDDFFSKISLRAIPFLLVFSKGLAPDIYVGGTGGLNDYYPEVNAVADRMKINLPVVAIWNPQDIYAGLGQVNAFLLFKKQRAKKQKAEKQKASLSPQKVKEKVSRIFTSKYSILDYATNIGLKKTSEQWLKHLHEQGLNGDAKMQTVFTTFNDDGFAKEYFDFVRALKNEAGFLDAEKIKIQFFEKLLKEQREGYKIMGYGSKSTQAIRFKVLTEIANLNGKSVLDVGCGLGHLADFFKENSISAAYTGYDLMKSFIDMAKKSHPGTRFELRNIMGDSMEALPKEKFGYVLACGILNIPIGHNEEYIRELIRRMFKLCKQGVAISMLSLNADYYDPKCYYYSPKKMLSWVLKEISRHAVLRHDYLPHDFTLYIYKKSSDKLFDKSDKE